MAETWYMGIAGLFHSYPEFLLAAACFFFFFLFLYYQTNRKSAIPIWPMVGMLPGLLSNRHHLHHWVTHDVLKESGCTFQFRGPWLLNMDFLVTCDPANVNHVFNLNFSNYPKGDQFSEVFDILGDGILNADDESWKIQRKKAHSLMSSPQFRSFVAERSRDKVEHGLLPLLNRVAEQGVVVDLQDVFLRLTFDITYNLVFGIDPKSLSLEFPMNQFANAMDDAMNALLLRHLVPMPWWKLMRWLRIGTERKMEEGRRVIDQFIAQSIAGKKEEKESYKHDLLTSYVNSIECNDHKFLRDTAVNLMLAGRDTTGVALAWFFWLLSNNPRVESKILEELMKGHSCLDFPIVFDDEGLRKFVYLHAALCEALRLFPPVPFEGKGALQPDVLPSGHKVKPSKMVFFSTYSMGRMEGVWGEDCLEFKPERWISEQGRVRHEPSYKFLSFNCGPRTCLGKDIAFTQLKAVVAAMVSNFHVEVVEGHVVEPKLSIILHMKDGLKVRVRQRRHAVDECGAWVLK